MPTRSRPPEEHPMTTDTTGTDELRTRLRGMWSGVADRWAQHADDVDASRAVVTTAMIERAEVGPGARVLELACGPGGVGLAAAPLVGPGGEVVLTDVVPEMTAVAAARAADLGLEHLTTRERDLEDIAEPACSFDAVLCREGLMFAPDPARAAAEIRRVLRPDGRAVLAVWGPRGRNPWLGLLFDAVEAQVGHPVPPPGLPGPFALSDAAALADLLRDAGFTDVTVEELPVPTRAASFDDWWTRTSALAGPLAGMLAAMPAEAVQALRERLIRDVATYTTADGLELPGLTLIATARRPLP
jgi:ubiquinone/menaquinone biosynthesis C-methylase UbiE